MRIPKYLSSKKGRFYVAESAKYAISSWSSYEEALSCIERFKQAYPDKHEDIKGIMEVNIKGQVWHGISTT